MENVQHQEVISADDEQASKSEAEKILAKILQEQGWIPKPLQIMARRPGAVETFIAYRNQILEGGPLNKREQALIMLSTAVALKSANCIRTHADNARKAGAHEDEIIQTMLIAGLMMGTSPLHTAYVGVED